MYVLLDRYDSELGIESLEIDWIAKQNAIQRQGRAGRVCKGACFKLYTNHFHLYAMRDRVTPEIRRVSLERSILRVKLIKNLGDKCVFVSIDIARCNLSLYNGIIPLFYNYSH